MFDGRMMRLEVEILQRMSLEMRIRTLEIFSLSFFSHILIPKLRLRIPNQFCNGMFTLHFVE